MYDLSMLPIVATEYNKEANVLSLLPCQMSIIFYHWIVRAVPNALFMISHSLLLYLERKLI